MEKKAYSPVLGSAVAIVAFAGFVGGGVVCFTLHHTLKIQRHDLGETQSRILALTQALEVQRHDLHAAREQLTAANNQVADTEKQNRSLHRQLTEIQSQVAESKAVAQIPSPPLAVPVMAPDLPAADSVEGKLRAEGKNWERAAGQPVAGGYVEDILDGRLNQPKGRGRIGMVMSLVPDTEGRPVATVDFGHGYAVGIATSELSPVRLVAPDMR